jgi:hypothetical protein
VNNPGIIKTVRAAEPRNYPHQPGIGYSHRRNPQDEHMTISEAIFGAFTQCLTKSCLSSNSAAVAETALGQAREHWELLYQRNASSRLCARALDGQSYVGTPAVQAIQQQQYRVILDCTFQTSDLLARVHGLELVRSQI